MPPTLPSVHGLRAGDDIAYVDELGLDVVHFGDDCGGNVVVVSGRESKRVPWTNESYRQTTVFILSWCFQAKEDLIGIVPI